jgi:hypothetical protein
MQHSRDLHLRHPDPLGDVALPEVLLDAKRKDPPVRNTQPLDLGR